MSLELLQSTQFKIQELTLVTKFGDFDISNIFQELNIFDSIFMPCIRGNIVILDAVGLSKKLLFDGSEYIKISIYKDINDKGTSISRAFRIYRQSDRKNSNQTSETYILYFTSEEKIYSEQQKINQSFVGNHDKIAKNILADYLAVDSSKLGWIEKTQGVHNVVMPNISPIDSLNWLTKRALNSENLPNIIFFENKAGFNFVSLSTLINLPAVFNINFQPKNISPNVGEEFLGARDVNALAQFDLIENIKNGVYAGKFIGFDTMTRQIKVDQIDYTRTYSQGKHLNPKININASLNRKGFNNQQMFDSKVTLYPFFSTRVKSPYINANDSTTANIIDDTHNYILQRRTILFNLMQSRVHMTLPGNFGISSGYNLFLKMPARQVDDDTQEGLDKSLYGKYLITATRHIIQYDKHETIVEVATDSSNKPFTMTQTNSMKEVVKT